MKQICRQMAGALRLRVDGDFFMRFNYMGQNARRPTFRIYLPALAQTFILKSLKIIGYSGLKLNINFIIQSFSCFLKMYSR